MDSSKVVETDSAGDSLFSRAFVLLLVAQTCFGMSFSAMFLLPKYLKLALHASDVEVGVTQALGALAGVFAFPVVGVLNDRFGKRPFVIAGATLMTLTVLVLRYVEDVGPLLYLSRVLQGLSFALLFNSATTLAAEGVPRERMGRALAVIGASMLATNALSPAIAEPLAHHYGWASLFTLSISWGVVSILAALFVSEKRARTIAGEARAGALDLLGEPRVRRVVLVMVAAGAGFGAVFTFHQPYALSLAIERVSGFFVSYAIFALLVRLVFMAQIDRVSRRRSSGLSLLLYALAIAATAFIRPGILELVGGIMGLAQGVFYPVFNALAIDSVPPKQRGSMMALYHGGFNAGIALSSFLGGSVAAHLGYKGLFFASGAITALAALSVLRTELFVEAPLKPAAPVPQE